jgi:hypothetical protein
MPPTRGSPCNFQTTGRLTGGHSSARGRSASQVRHLPRAHGPTGGSSAHTIGSPRATESAQSAHEGPDSTAQNVRSLHVGDKAPGFSLQGSDGATHKLSQLRRKTSFLRDSCTRARRLRAAPPRKKVSIQDIVAEIRTNFDISDEQALYIRKVTDEKMKDRAIQATVEAGRQFLPGGPFRLQVDGEIQVAYAERGRSDGLAEDTYSDPDAIFDIMGTDDRGTCPPRKSWCDCSKVASLSPGCQ